MSLPLRLGQSLGVNVSQTFYEVFGVRGRAIENLGRPRRNFGMIGSSISPIIRGSSAQRNGSVQESFAQGWNEVHVSGSRTGTVTGNDNPARVTPKFLDVLLDPF